MAIVSFYRGDADNLPATKVDGRFYLTSNGQIIVDLLEDNALKRIVLNSKDTIGLGNVDNTADIDKPISTAVQTVLTQLREDLSSVQSTLNSQSTYVTDRALVFDIPTITDRTLTFVVPPS